MTVDEGLIGRRTAPVRVVVERAPVAVFAAAVKDGSRCYRDPVATAGGMPSVFGHGMLSMGLLATAITDWVGALRRSKVRFSSQTSPGEEVRTRVTVVGLRDEELLHLADLRRVLESTSGEVKVLGEATVELAPRA